MKISVLTYFNKIQGPEYFGTGKSIRFSIIKKLTNYITSYYKC